MPGSRRHDLFHLISGQAVSTLGSSVYLLGVTLHLKDTTGSATVLGLYHFLALLPPVLLGPFGGAIVDAVRRVRVLVVTDVVRGALMVLLGLLVYLMPTSILPILVATFLGGFAQALFVPAARAVLPELVPPARLRRANALRTGLTQLANLGGNAAGGAAYVLLGMPVLLVANGITFIVSAVEETRIRPRNPRQRAPKSSPASRTLLSDAREGLATVWKNPGLRTLALAGSAVQFIAPPLVLSLPFVVLDALALPESALGYYFAMMLAGGIVGFVLLSVWEVPPRGEFRLFVASLVAFAVAAAAGGLYLSTAVLAVVLFTAGFSVGTAAVLVHTVVQRSVSSDRQGRVFAVVEMVAGASAPIAYLGSGIVVDFVLSDLRMVYLVTAALVLLVAAAAAGSRSLRQVFLLQSADTAAG